jgi:hypothetical protein
MVIKWVMYHEFGFANVKLSQASVALNANAVLFFGVSIVIIGFSWLGVDGQGTGLAIAKLTV